MTLKEVVESGKPFKRKEQMVYYTVSKQRSVIDGIDFSVLIIHLGMASYVVRLPLDYAVAEDWEIVTPKE